MQITVNKVASFDFRVSDEAGMILDSSDESGAYQYLHGTGHLIPGLESAMEGKSPGDSFSITVPPALGYGERDEALIQTIPRDRFEGIDDLQEGMMIEAHYEDGPKTMAVTMIGDQGVTIDGNHPLAGITLNFEITVVDVRDATPEEMEHSHLGGGCDTDCGCGCEDECGGDSCHC